MMITIQNQQTGEILEIVRDVTVTYPDWVHQQCETQSEEELQAMLDQMGGFDASQGRDACGILVE